MAVDEDREAVNPAPHLLDLRVDHGHITVSTGYSGDEGLDTLVRATIAGGGGDSDMPFTPSPVRSECCKVQKERRNNSNFRWAPHAQMY